MDHQVLGVSYGVVGAADHECGTAVRGNQVSVTGGTGDGDSVTGASPDGHAVEMAGVVAVAKWLLTAAPVLGVSRWRCHGSQAQKPVLVQILWGQTDNHQGQKILASRSFHIK